MSNILLIDIAGRDQPGITAALTQVLADAGVSILDIGQSTIHNNLALGFLVDIGTDIDGQAVQTALKQKGQELGLDIQCTPVSDDAYEDWVALQGQPRHMVTLLARRISATQLSRVSALVTERGLNIERITRLTGRISRRQPSTKQRSVVQFALKGPVTDISDLHSAFLALGNELELDIAIQEDDIFRRNRRLVCFDMDSTLIQAEVIDELARVAGVGEQVAAITESAMRGEIDFSESFRRRMALLEGLEESVLEGIAERLPITDGAERLIGTLKQIGYKIAILSGGFTYFAEHLQRRLDIDYVHANQLEFEQGRLTGRVSGSIVDGARKAQLLREIAQKEGIRLEQVIAVGDGANDLPMLSIAGLGIAFHAKPLVKQQARHALNTVGLDGILYLLGVQDRDLQLLGRGLD